MVQTMWTLGCDYSFTACNIKSPAFMLGLELGSGLEGGFRGFLSGSQEKAISLIKY